jgi:hypothetical protein
MENHLAGLPEHGVLLTGTPENPVIENRSGRAVIAYRLKKAGQSGHGPAPFTLLAFSGQPAGIPDGGAVFVHGNVPINLAGQVQVLSPFHSTSLLGPIESPVIVSATLHSVIFGDGQFVGLDEEWVFEHFGRVIKVMAEVGLLAKAGAWDQIKVLDFSAGPRAPASGEDPRTYFERRIAALFLVQERKHKGDAAAAQLAEIYSSLPAPWRQ